MRHFCACATFSRTFSLRCLSLKPALSPYRTGSTAQSPESRRVRPACTTFRPRNRSSANCRCFFAQSPFHTLAWIMFSDALQFSQKLHYCYNYSGYSWGHMLVLHHFMVTPATIHFIYLEGIINSNASETVLYREGAFHISLSSCYPWYFLISCFHFNKPCLYNTKWILSRVINGYLSIRYESLKYQFEILREQKKDLITLAEDQWIKIELHLDTIVRGEVQKSN